jgi:hypothetical protein
MRGTGVSLRALELNRAPDVQRTRALGAKKRRTRAPCPCCLPARDSLRQLRRCWSAP